jgi:hypothetical protein
VLTSQKSCTVHRLDGEKVLMLCCTNLRRFWAFFAGSFAIFVAGQCLAARYELQIDGTSPNRATIRLVLESTLESDTAFSTRQLGDNTNLGGSICEDTGRALVPMGMIWLAHAGCSVITWETRFETASLPSFDVSTQTSLYHQSGWWLFSEWGNLLRLQPNAARSEICARTGSTETCRRVPTVNEPPLLMLIGEPSADIVLGESTFRFFSGHLPRSFDVKDLYGSYERQLTYLHSLMAKERGTSPPSVIDVLVLGIDDAQGVTGGAAGSGSFLANVVVTDGRVNPAERTRLLWLSGHELSHLLGMNTGALWATESLAHYYGFKSLEEVEDASEIFAQMVENVERMGLLDAHERVTQRGEMQHYGLFYSRGAAFWRELDEAISAATGDGRSLDEFLPLLLKGEFGVDGALPWEFVESAISSVGPDVIEPIFRDYL